MILSHVYRLDYHYDTKNRALVYSVSAIILILVLLPIFKKCFSVQTNWQRNHIVKLFPKHRKMWVRIKLGGVQPAAGLVLDHWRTLSPLKPRAGGPGCVGGDRRMKGNVWHQEVSRHEPEFHSFYTTALIISSVDSFRLLVSATPPQGTTSIHSELHRNLSSN